MELRVKCSRPRMLRRKRSLKERLRRPHEPDYVDMPVPCGKCLPCRIARSREWSLRCSHELSTCTKQSLFITLTYSDEYNPVKLVKSDLQNFFKRLRRDGCVFRYFASGEYGEKSLRPHFHIIFFNCGFYITLMPDGSYQCPVVSSNWTFGRHHVGSVTDDSMRYTADYALKSLRHTEFDDTVPPAFMVSSKGLGKAWCLAHRKLVEGYHLTYRGKKVNIPRYYAKLLNLDVSMLTEDYRAERDNKLAELAGSDVSFDKFVYEEKLGVQRGYNAEARESLKGDTIL